VDQALAYRTEMDYDPFIEDMIIEPGLKKLLDLLKPDFGLSVATNRSNTIEKVLEIYGLRDYFDIVVSSLDVQFPKPHPESLLKILAFFQIHPHEAVYVGDSSVDCETARAAKVPFVAYDNRTLAADHHVKNLKEMGTLLAGLEDR
jgi:HAD superfamily hydrolase (TIGR01509 family)